jgi:hypothetical protein
MERGLIWLPLLALFIGLAWAGWNEYQKLQGYQQWAKGFDRSKYDIYAALGQQGDRLTWGKPTRQGLINLQTLTRNQVQSITLLIGSQRWQDSAIATLEPAHLPSGQPIALELTPPTGSPVVQIPFTDTALALQWAQWLHRSWL